MRFKNPYMTKAEQAENDDTVYATFNDEPSMTQVADASETNINVIMAKYQKTGQLPRVLAEPLFGDFSEAPDYRAAVEAVNAAQEAFMEIPAKIRAEFGNDPAEFIRFASNPENKEQLSQWGLTAPPKQPTIEEQTLEALKGLKTPPPTGNTP